jgi:N-acetylneuraminate lyase
MTGTTEEERPLRGMIAAFCACYDDAGNISPIRTQTLARHLMVKGVQGLYVNGMAGECLYLSMDERKKVLENVMTAVNGNVPVIAQVAANSLRDSAQLAEHAQALRVDAIAALPPIGACPPEHAISKYWNDISAAAKDTDLVLCAAPQMPAGNLPLTLFEEMLKNPRVKALFMSALGAQEIRAFKDVSRGRIAVFGGDEEQLIPDRVMGADGGVYGMMAVAPSLFLKADRLLDSGSVKQAKELQYDIGRIKDALCAAKGDMPAMMKEMLRRKGVHCGGVRAPLYPVQAEDAAQIEVCLDLISRAEQKALGM